MGHRASGSGQGHDRACEHCGAFFIARRSDRRFCSDRCRLRHWRMLKSGLGPMADDESAARSPSQTAREILLGLLTAEMPTVVAERVRTAIAELSELDREIVRVRRRNARRATETTAGSPRDSAAEVGSSGC